jgi:hypothetical protein
MARVGIFILLLIVNVMLAGCGSPSHRRWPQPREHLPATCEIEGVPFYPQEAFQCGPAALAMVLGWSGISVDPDQLAPQVFTPSRKGSLQSAIIGSSRRHGRIAYALSAPEALIEEVGAGYPIIVLQNLGFSWQPVWHYAVVIGYDLNQGFVILRSGVTPRKRLSLRAFRKTWAGSDCWGLLVLPPTRMPITATEESYISAVLGLEMAGQWEAAVEGYKTALARWRDSLGARMGLGNTYYASGDKESAEAAFREVTRRFPTNGSAYNNLAQVLWEQGEQEDAVKAARRAVALGGPLSDVYRETLEQIENSLQPR